MWILKPIHANDFLELMIYKNHQSTPLPNWITILIYPTLNLFVFLYAYSDNSAISNCVFSIFFSKMNILAIHTSIIAKSVFGALRNQSRITHINVCLDISNYSHELGRKRLFDMLLIFPSNTPSWMLVSVEKKSLSCIKSEGLNGYSSVQFVPLGE